MRQNTKHRGIFRSGVLTLAVAAALLAGMSGCVGLNLNSARTVRGIAEGSGEVVAREFDVADFDKLRIDGDYAVHYTRADACGVSVEMQESLFEYIEVTSDGGELYITSDRLLHNSGTANRAPIVTVSAPTLTGMDFSGAVTVDDSDAIEGDALSISTAGAGSIALRLAVEELTVSTAGASDMELSGTAASVVASSAGAGELNALELETKNTEISISGAGSGSITCSDVLDVSISGAGSFEYRGDATVNQNIAGFGSVKKVD